MAPTGFPFSFNGKDYVLRRVTQDDKSVLLAAGNAQLLADVAAVAPYQSAEQAGVCFDQAMKRVIARTLWWDEPDGQVYRFSRAGFTRLCWLCLRDADPEKPRPKLEVAEAIYDLDNGATLDRHYKAANANPTDPRPSAAGGGEASTSDSPSSGDALSEKSAD